MTPQLTERRRIPYLCRIFGHHWTYRQGVRCDRCNSRPVEIPR